METISESEMSALLTCVANWIDAPKDPEDKILRFELISILIGQRVVVEDKE